MLACWHGEGWLQQAAGSALAVWSTGWAALAADLSSLSPTRVEHGGVASAAWAGPLKAQ